MRHLAIFLSLLSCYLCKAQNVDSLVKVFNDKSKHDTIRIKAMGQVAAQFRDQNPDTAIYFCNKLFDFSTSVKNAHGQMRALSIKGQAFSNKGEYDSALTYLHKSNDIFETYPEKEKQTYIRSLAINTGAIGMIHYRRGSYRAALNFFLETLKFYKAAKDTHGIGYANSCLGFVYHSQNNYKMALKYYEINLRININEKDTVSMAWGYNNIAALYYAMKDTMKAIVYEEKSLSLFESGKNNRGIGYACNNLSVFYNEVNETDKALAYANRALEIRTQLKDKQAMSQTYGNIGLVYLNKKQPLEALKYCKKGEALGEETDALETTQYCYKCISDAYEKLGKAVEAIVYYKKYIAARDTLEEQRRGEEISKLQMQHEYEKKTTTDSIRSAEKDKVINTQMQLQESKLQQEKMQRYGLYGGLTVLIVFLTLIYNRFRLTKKQKLIIEQKNEETEIQKMLIEEKQKEIVDSINYAKRIQYALLAHDEFLKKHIENYFIFFKPKDIVSGDFYWAAEHNGYFFIAVCDSTGHGVPGAFMSLLSIGFLSEAIRKEHCGN